MSHSDRANDSSSANPPFAANDVRLSPREWIIALGVAAVILAGIPFAWKQIEPIRIETNHRIPFSLGHDYWTYDRYCQEVSADRDTMLVVGDSVVWGHFVGKDQTLPAHLNEARSDRRFANMGVDGIHPAALAGLMEHYGRAISGRKVILHCNLLWMSSPRYDLAGSKEISINHPDLIPQFFPDIECYQTPRSRSHRLGVLIGRRVPVFSWANHMQIAYFDDSDLPTWTIGHPRDNPIDAITLELPSPNEPPTPKPDIRPWTQKDIGQFDPPWVNLDNSFQWRCFRRTIEILTGRGNRVFVVVGPFNEHMLSKKALATYATMTAKARRWLGVRKIPHYAPKTLPSGTYADASHPLRQGYALLAEGLLANEAFIRFAGDKQAAPAAVNDPKPQQIVFSSNRSGQWRIWTINSDGTNLKQLSKAPRDDHDVDPVFSPDGKSVLFTSTRGGKTGVWRLGVDGSKPERICDGDQAEWSPRGKKIVLRRAGRILVRELASGKEKTISPKDLPHCGGPSWSPDGKTVAIASRSDGNNAIYLLPAGGGKPTRVYDKKGACEPHWSPDGKMLVYETETHICTIRPDGTKNRLVTWFGGVQRYGRFSPDSKQIVFCQGASERGPWELYIIPVGGRTPRKLTSKGSDMYPDWKKPTGAAK